jgi:VanZ family protein
MIRPWTLRLAFWAAWTFSLVMAVLPHPPEVPGHPSDKLQHIAAFITLSLLGSWAYPRIKPLKLLLLLSLFGAFIEVLQAIPALNRDSDLLDWVADTIAVAVTLALIGWWRAHADRHG